MYTLGNHACQQAVMQSPNLTSSRALSARDTVRHFQTLTETHPLSARGINRLAAAQGGVETLFGPLLDKKLSGQDVCSERAVTM